MRTGRIPKEALEAFCFGCQVQAWFCLDLLIRLGADVGALGVMAAVITPAKAGPSGETAVPGQSDRKVGLSPVYEGGFGPADQPSVSCRHGAMGRELMGGRSLAAGDIVGAGPEAGVLLSPLHQPACKADLFLQKHIGGTRCTERARRAGAGTWDCPGAAGSLGSEQTFCSVRS